MHIDAQMLYSRNKWFIELILSGIFLIFAIGLPPAKSEVMKQGQCEPWDQARQVLRSEGWKLAWAGDGVFPRQTRRFFSPVPGSDDATPAGDAIFEQMFYLSDRAKESDILRSHNASEQSIMKFQDQQQNLIRLKSDISGLNIRRLMLAMKDGDEGAILLATHFSGNNYSREKPEFDETCVLELFRVCLETYTLRATRRRSSIVAAA